MAKCERCTRDFTPLSPDMTKLCEDCVNDILADRQAKSPRDEDESRVIIEDVITCINEDSPVQKLLDSPGAALALAKLTHVSKEDIHMLALNSFRMGAYLAFKQAEVNTIIN